MEYFYIPKAYRNEEFDKIVAMWQETFKDENLLSSSLSFSNHTLLKNPKNRLFSIKKTLYGSKSIFVKIDYAHYKKI